MEEITENLLTEEKQVEQEQNDIHKDEKVNHKSTKLDGLIGRQVVMVNPIAPSSSSLIHGANMTSITNHRFDGSNMSGTRILQ